MSFTFFLIEIMKGIREF